MTKIEQLENEIRQKNDELNISLNTQNLLRERLKSNTDVLREIESLLKTVETNLRRSNDYNYTLEQENKCLKLSCDKWIQRAINLEFKVLNARERAKKSK